MVFNSCVLPGSEDVVSGFEESEDTDDGIDWLKFYSSENFDTYLNDTLLESFTESGLVSGLSGYFVCVASEGYENL